MNKFITKIFIIPLIILIYGNAIAGCNDLIIKKISHELDYAINSNPIIDIVISNPSSTICNQSFSEGFISCRQGPSKALGTKLFKSNAIPAFILNPGSEITAGNLKLSNEISKDQGNDKKIDCDISSNTNSITGFTINIIEARRFDTSLNTSIKPIKGNLDAAEGSLGIQGVQNFIFKKVMDIVFPIIIVVGLLTAMMGFYKILFSSSEDASKDGIKFIIYGILGIIIISSAKYIGSTLFNDMFASGNMSTMSPPDIAIQLYEKIAFPFIKIAVYLVLGYLFISLAFRVFYFITSGDDSIKKKSIGIILRDVVGMLIVIGSKEIVEAIYGKKSEVLNANAQNLGDIGTGILADKNIPIIYSIINRILGISVLIILVIIIIQSLQLLLKPDDADKVKKIRKSIMYIFIGVLIIGTGYIVTNVLIVN